MTILGADHPGIVDRLAKIVRQHNGNWLDSQMARLCGQFAGIVSVRIPANNMTILQHDLESLSTEGLTVVIQPGLAEDQDQASPKQQLIIEILSPDRPGILRELTAVLAAHQVNVDGLSTSIVPAQFSGEPLFKAHLRVTLPSLDTHAPLSEAIQSLATDMALDLTLANP